MDSPKRGSNQHQQRKLPLLPLVFLIFYEVSGGPFGVEDAVGAGGALLTLLGFIVMPFLWSIPEAVITAELATAFPDNGGYVLWIQAAFGPFWGFQEGWWKWLSGVIDNALYPVMFLDYLKWAIPSVAGGVVRLISLLVITAALTIVNYRGLTIVGYTAVALGIFSLLPFVVLFFLAIPSLEPARWLEVDLRDTNWTLYLNTLFWNLNYWDSVSTLVGEVDRPHETVPRALAAALVLVVASYLLPLLAGTGAAPPGDRKLWADGYFAHIALKIGGGWLKWWVELAALLSNAGMFEAEMSSDSFQLLGMAERGILPAAFARRSRYGTPVLGILFSATGVILLSWLNFQEIIEILNFLYCCGMLLEFAAFVWLRIKQPNLVRPYKVPLGTIGVTVMCLVPSVLLVVVMCIASAKTVVLSVVFSLVGFAVYPAIQLAKKKSWLSFIDAPDPIALNKEKIPALAEERIVHAREAGDEQTQLLCS
ncbi:hypothetical protein SELMODRAFT_138613 [Selaginella moellendorffii]|uniref:Uncharacterized protein LAT2-1 n=1 Tax=Selaginella moellendorffii TaxID=88036 RepID=D8TFT1_SELML|nr:probable polyamine transporter At1g31830 [Selaginella moellendorffii]EFJ04485.1 hypothetical protein SELMODRAFT_138613 [Selaginella moellendorffii]|eukprot:XP_002994449.1 probable polyamine transporter At1g31830 [Selaginella moellendorffii]